ncbi:Surface polysaccharide O-acyltransferase, integral membrane enzyme [Gemmobacter aquatilis]|uniref:Surface polysaccharide O-acyltransferase, integral membrane enzyme n=1 Tax=Gemmobacter aquatilis TaxID=933059 RepID=A0A1H8JTW8_9RHOB|nr:acyltransferase family protein [Gemmobacter aquatilis]SEN84162.1 Surface polysaccharide O-acyltransferase, integral membrane enzyme [Gemmobacter aquatilis]
MSAQARQHRQSIDLARTLAAFGVVAVHIHASVNDWFGHVALALFLVLSAFLTARAADRNGGRPDWPVRVRRILLPWVFWSAAYWLLNALTAEGASLDVLPREPLSLLVGASIHLWFLPFVLLAGLVVRPVLAFTRTVPRLALAALGLGLVGVPLFWVHTVFPFAPEPLPQWAYAVPPFLCGVLLVPAHRMQRIVLPLAALGGLNLVALVMSHGAPWAWTTLAGALAFETFWNLPVEHPVLPVLGRSCFGVYLLHPFFMLVGYKLFGTGVPWPLFSLLVFALSALTALGLQRLPLIRAVV